MQLKDLIGAHTLSGVETGDMIVDGTQSEYVKFTLDGVHYLAVKDPDDGYRSHCEELEVSEEPPRFTFPPHQVDCVMMGDDEWGRHDVLSMTDIVTGETVLEVGTMNYDDWYPVCHFYYAPENLACNAGVIEISDDEFDKIYKC